MKRLVLGLTFVLALICAASIMITSTSPAVAEPLYNGQETCPTGDGWVKYEGEGEWTHSWGGILRVTDTTWFLSFDDGLYWMEVCSKAATDVQFYTCEDSPCSANVGDHDISHMSIRGNELPATPTPTDPPDTPTPTNTEPPDTPTPTDTATPTEPPDTPTPTWTSTPVTNTPTVTDTPEEPTPTPTRVTETPTPSPTNTPPPKRTPTYVPYTGQVLYSLNAPDDVAGVLYIPELDIQTRVYLSGLDQFGWDIGGIGTRPTLLEDTHAIAGHLGGMFYDLYLLDVGDTIYYNGLMYEMVEERFVDPSDLEVLSEGDLVLFTCSWWNGSVYRYRRVIIAELVQ